MHKMQYETYNEKFDVFDELGIKPNRTNAKPLTAIPRTDSSISGELLSLTFESESMHPCDRVNFFSLDAFLNAIGRRGVSLAF